MKDLIKKFNNLMSEGLNVVDNTDNSKTKSQLMKTLTVSLLTASIIAPSFSAVAESVNTSNISDIEKIQVQHISSSALKLQEIIGDSFDTGSVYMNNEHPVMKHINDFLLKKVNSGSQEDIEKIKKDVENANKYMRDYSEQGYKLMDSYANILSSLVNDKAVEFYSTTKLMDMDPYERLLFTKAHSGFKSIVKEMKKDPDFGQYFSSYSFNDIYHNITQEVGTNFTGFYANDPYTHKIVHHQNSNAFISWALMYSYTHPEGRDVAVKEVMDLKSEITNLTIKSYDLSPLDVELLVNKTQLHEMGHALIFDMAKGTNYDEFTADLVALWAGIQNGGSENYYNYFLDHIAAGMGSAYITDVHVSSGLIIPFAGEDGYSKLKEMTIEDVKNESLDFLDGLRNDDVDLHLAGYLAARQHIMEDGAIYSNLNDYIEKWSLEDTKVADIYEKSNEAAMDGGATYRYNYISEYNSASSFEQFFMEDPEDFRADKVPDLNYFSEEVEELNQYIESYNNNEIESKSVTIDKSFLIDDEGLGM